MQFQCTFSPDASSFATVQGSMRSPSIRLLLVTSIGAHSVAFLKVTSMSALPHPGLAESQKTDVPAAAPMAKRDSKRGAYKALTGK
eukprot:CAMPEP_0204593620 /NCGR_PEP_ID=MMETSP0661-20131031/51613_1 /ASSEMBLY_ACC=CAM_ASM_000606 /TAXON_ID=109239 /ORGANISM="Alexandrium margalefi, Strain AMGDE01CS-322" /LENGTH=85 /DNA_ID=CAMNT_0051603945 /DNA_START=391 /DNA_END=648 /DNA_ORIENTATION=-